MLPPVKPLRHCLRNVLIGIAAITAFSASSNKTNAQGYTFVPNTPLYTEMFNGLDVGDQITTIGWSNSVTENPDAEGGTPPGTGYPGTLVLTNTTSTRNNLTSPVLPALDFGLSNVLYASGYFYSTTGASSGARVLLRYASGGNHKFVGGFGILDTANKSFSLYNDTGWVYSSESAIANHWYEIALVVQLDESDISLSKGYLFVRDATAGETSFRLIEDLAGIPLGYTESHQFSTFTNWRIEGFRSNGRFGLLSVGTGTLVIPETKTSSLLLFGTLAVGGFCCIRRKQNA